ncbi:hypothetical protein MALGJ_21950 [Mycolicibacter algericus]|uniref:Uncharacterized protein n=1 Tax=Mycolicibacter algericus TaxID=1288388 RepID=A0A7I9Y9Z0_MYCAL|nr:hypothetical protein MALGJ_21950 [Mycolicibacter algericus]
MAADVPGYPMGLQRKPAESSAPVRRQPKGFGVNAVGRICPDLGRHGPVFATVTEELIGDAFDWRADPQA